MATVEPHSVIANTNIKLRGIDVPWFIPSIDNQLPPQARKLFEDYSHIPPNEVEDHVLKIRSLAWQIHPYPCIGLFRFLSLNLTSHPSYPQVLSLLHPPTAGATTTTTTTTPASPRRLLDLGCCFGQDLRALIAAGVPSTQLYGSDLRPEFWSLGYQLFRDQDRNQSTFVAGDVFASATDDAGKGLAELDGKMDVVYVSSFLHLFNYEGQVKAAERIVRLLKPRMGSLVVGRQLGGVVPEEMERKVDGEGREEVGKKQTMYRHNVASFQEMWRVVGENTGSKWRVEAALKSVKFHRLKTITSGEQVDLLTFTVTRED